MKNRQPVANNIASFTVTASPNPVSDILTINYTGLDEAENSSINLLSVDGKVVKAIALGKVQSGKESFNVKLLPAGVFTLQLLNGKNIQSTKIIKQ